MASFARSDYRYIDDEADWPTDRDVSELLTTKVLFPCNSSNHQLDRSSSNETISASAMIMKKRGSDSKVTVISPKSEHHTHDPTHSHDFSAFGPPDARWAASSPTHIMRKHLREKFMHEAVVDGRSSGSIGSTSTTKH